MAPPGCKERELFDICFDQDVRQTQIFIKENIQQTSFCSNTENFWHRRASDVRVDQQHRAVHLHRDAHSQIDSAKTFPFSRKSAGDHDQVPILDHARPLVERVREQRPLNYAKLLGYLRSSLIWRDDAILPHFCKVELDAV